MSFLQPKILYDAVKERMIGTFSRLMRKDRYGRAYGSDQHDLAED
jgi:hypothetical protein